MYHMYFSLSLQVRCFLKFTLKTVFENFFNDLKKLLGIKPNQNKTNGTSKLSMSIWHQAVNECQAGFLFN